MGYDVVTCAALYPTLIPLWSHTHTLKWDSRLISFFNSHLIYKRGLEYICKHTHLTVIIAPLPTHTPTHHMNTQAYATIIMCQADKHTHRNDSRLYSGVCLAPLPRMLRSTRLARIITGLPLIRLQNQQQLFLKARAENRQPMHNTRIIIISAVRPVCVCLCVHVYIRAWRVCRHLIFLFFSFIVILQSLLTIKWRWWLSKTN